jgi:hypothetical protein
MKAARNNGQIEELTPLEPGESNMTDHNDKEARLEEARKALLITLNLLRERALSAKEADAVEAAIEDELIALRVTSLCSGELRRPV